MMGVPPPSGGFQSSNSNRVTGDRDRDRDRRPNKDFDLNRRREEDALSRLKENLKDLVSSLKNLPDGKKSELEEKVKKLEEEIKTLDQANPAAFQDTINNAKQLMQEAESLKGTGVIASADQAKTVSAVMRLIQQMCSELALGQGTAMATLKEGPQSLLGTTLVIQSTPNGVSISFQGINAVNAKEAAALMENNPELLEKLASDLAAKNIQATSINLGGHATVAIPTPPGSISPILSESSQESRDREGGRQGGGEKEGRDDKDKEKRER